MKYAKYILTSLVLVVLIFGSFSPKATKKTEYMMDTVITITAYGFGASNSVDKAFSEIKRIDELLSVYNPKSEISKINSNASGGFVPLSDEVYSLLKEAVALSEKTDGAFDITLRPISLLWGIGTKDARVPSSSEIEEALLKTGYQNLEFDDEKKAVRFKLSSMSIDLGAIAKGYASQKATEVLKNDGVKNAVLDLGGNVSVLGSRPLSLFEALKHKSLSRPFTIGVQNPDKSRGDVIDTITASGDCFIITSGSYERFFEADGTKYHHIIDPKTGRPAKSGIKSATVVTKEGHVGDALSTAAFVMGKNAKDVLAPMCEDIILIDDDLNILR